MRLTQIDSSRLNEPSRYYNDGFVLLSVENQTRLVEVLNRLLVEKPREGYTWDNVQNSHSLRPHVYDYDPSVLDFLFDNKLPEKLARHTERNLTLSHIQIVKTDPGRSYQDWHRDTYQPGNSPWIGNTPPAHKIIFYPTNTSGPEPRLKFVRASHRCAANNPAFDDNLIRTFENEVLDSDNNRILMFDTSMLHGVIPDVSETGSIRIIYNFITELQYREVYSSKSHHKVLHDMYEERMRS